MDGTQRAFAGGLEVNPKADSEIIGLAILILRQVAWPSICQGTSRSIGVPKVQGTWRTLHPRRILHAPDTTSVHGGLLVSSENKTLVLRSQV